MARLGLALLVAAAVAVTVAWGFTALATFAFFVAIAAAVAYGARVGGDWLQGASRGRFDDRGRGE